MAFSQWLILHIPAVLLCIILMTIAIISSVGGIFITRHFVSHRILKMHNDIAGAIFATLGVIYAVLLAFTVIITWENFDKAHVNVEKEANCLTDLYRNSESFQEPFKHEVHVLLSEYANTTVNEAWEKLVKGQASTRMHELVKRLWASYSSYTPKTLTEQIFFEESVDKLNELCELRRSRLFESRTGIHSMLWSALIAGGMITVVFTFFFGSENLRAQMMMSSLLAVLIALVLFTVLEFDFPFSGRACVSPEPFEQAIEFIK